MQSLKWVLPLALLSSTALAQTYPAPTFSGWEIIGSSTGVTTFASANAGASNYVLTFPAVTGTIATTANIGSALPSLTTSQIYGGTGAAGAAQNYTIAANTLLGATAGGSPVALPINGGLSCLTALTWTNGSGIGCAAAPGGGGVSSVGNATADTSLTMAGTGSGPWTGAVTAKVNLANANLWAALQSFTKSDFALLGTSTGYTILNSGLTGAGNNTLALPVTASDTLAALGTVQSWSAVQTFGTSDLVINGGSATAGVATVTSGGVVSSEAAVTGPQGGLGLTTAAIGDIPYASATTPVWSRLADVAVGSVLKSGGTSTAPAYTTTPQLGASGTLGSITLGNATSGLLTVQPAAGALGTVTDYLPVPSASTDTLALLGTPDQVQAGGVHLTSYGNSTGNVTVDCGKNPQQYIINGGAFTITAPAADGNCILLMRNNGSAGAVTFSGFTVGSSTGATLDTTNGHLFSIFIWRITDGTGAVAAYSITAHQ